MFFTKKNLRFFSILQKFLREFSVFGTRKKNYLYVRTLQVGKKILLTRLS